TPPQARRSAGAAAPAAPRGQATALTIRRAADADSGALMRRTSASSTPLTSPGRAHRVTTSSVGCGLPRTDCRDAITLRRCFGFTNEVPHAPTPKARRLLLARRVLRRGDPPSPRAERLDAGGARPQARLGTVHRRPRRDPPPPPPPRGAPPPRTPPTPSPARPAPLSPRPDIPPRLAELVRSAPRWFEHYVELESQASKLSIWANSLIPGLFQIEEYARAAMHAA